MGPGHHSVQLKAQSGGKTENALGQEATHTRDRNVTTHASPRAHAHKGPATAGAMLAALLPAWTEALRPAQWPGADTSRPSTPIPAVTIRELCPAAARHSPAL